jgi:hypothetical protein
VTEVRGASQLLYHDGVTANEDTAAAIGHWLERIAHDLERLEGGILRGDLARDGRDTEAVR